MYEQRVNRVLAEMRKDNLTQMIVSDPTGIFYLTGIMIKPMERLFALYLNQNGGHVLFLNHMFTLDNRTGIREVWMNDTDDCVGIVAQNVDHSSNMGIDKEWPARFVLGLMEKNPGVKYKTCYAVDYARMVKDEGEIEKMRISSRINDEVMDALTDVFAEDMTELDAGAALDALFKARGGTRYGGAPLICFGKNAADPHHHADQTPLKPGDCVLIDMGCGYEGYLSDMTRTFYYQNVSEKEREIYQIVLEANLLAESMIKPGVALRDLDNAARGHIAGRGYGKYFTHRLGHFIGSEVHEYGDVSSVSDIVAQAGMIFSIEPGIYLPGETGVRIEDLVLVTASGCEVLNAHDKRLTILK